jgi:MFS transporter, Spinster family, sphingosine-1-phosphate transporter
MKLVLSNKVFLFVTLATSCLYFVITGIQFWITDYMITILHYNPDTVFITFTTACISGPTIGVFVGGVVTHKLGGY